MATATLIRTTCSDCTERVVLDVDKAVVTARRASNGKRGSLHVPAADVTSDLSGDESLLEWDCPLCGHADSFDLVDGVSL